MSDPLGKTAKHTSIYAIGVIMSRMVSFVMLPIYTRFLTPEDYGVIELLQMTLDLTSLFLGFKAGEAILRYHALSKDDDERREYASTALLASMGLNGLGVLLLAALAGPITEITFGSALEPSQLRLFSVSLLFSSIGASIFTFLRAEQRPWLFVSLSTIRLIMQLGLNIYFVVVLGLHVEGVIYSVLVSGSVMSVILMGYAIRRLGLRWSARKAKELLSFTWPLILSGMGAFYLTFGDRYFLRVSADLAEVGVYSLAYRFAFLLVTMGWTPFFNIWGSQRYEVYRQEDGQKIFGNTFLGVSYVLILFSLGISVFVGDLLTVMAEESFWRAASIVPVLQVAYVLQCWTSYGNLGILVEKKTIHITYGSLWAGGVITLGYIFLIPWLGGLGAAWATVFAFGARFLWIYKASQRSYDMQLPWRPIFFLSALATGAYALSTLDFGGQIRAFLMHALIVLAYLAATWFLPIFAKEQRAYVLETVQKRSAPIIRAARRITGR